jgi:hypothetical protein
MKVLNRFSISLFPTAKRPGLATRALLLSAVLVER